MNVSTSGNGATLLEWLAIVITVALASLTVYAASAPVVGTDSFNRLELLWPVAAIAWAVAIFAATSDRRARVAAGIALSMSILSLASFGFPLFVLLFVGPAAIGLSAVFVAAVFFILLRRVDSQRGSWFIAPAIVLATLATLYSGAPRLLRFAIAEPALSTFAQQVVSGDILVRPDVLEDPIVVGSIPIYQIVRRGNEVLFVTAYVGILADDAAGLTYIPSGLPAGEGEYEHLRGPWYSWSPY